MTRRIKCIQRIAKGSVAPGVLLLMLAAAILPASAAFTLPGDYRIEKVVALDRPQAMAIAPDGRIFIAERQSGDVRIVQNGELLPTPFVHVDVAGGAEEGLLGIALHPQFARNGYVYLYYTQQAPRTNQIVRYTAAGNVGYNPVTILPAIGSSATRINNGGGMVFGLDGMLYAAVGDMGVGSDAQSMSSLAGKVLRMKDDGGMPTDNPHTGLAYPYHLIYAVGFRNTPGLDTHASAGTLYAGDDYDSDATCDETNVVTKGSSYGWNLAACSAGSQKGPLHNISAQMGVSGLASYDGGVYPGFDDNLFVSGTTTGEIIRDVLNGADFDNLVSSEAFYDPQEAVCPLNITDIAVNRGGWLWALSGDASSGTGGLYRILYRGDFPGSKAYPREVSGGHGIDLWVEKDGAGLKLKWEDLKQEAWLCTTGHCPTGSRTEKYTLWDGDLDGTIYNHTVLADTNGTTVNESVLSYSIGTMPAGNKYYLAGAWGGHQEGTLGFATGGSERPGRSAPANDVCNNIGHDDINPGSCMNDWPKTYPDQFNRQWKLSDFRGKYVQMGFEQFG